MPKIRTHTGAKKRFRKSIKGKWKHRKAGLRHLLTGMSAKRGRHLRTEKIVDKNSPEGKVLKNYLPYE